MRAYGRIKGFKKANVQIDGLTFWYAPRISEELPEESTLYLDAVEKDWDNSTGVYDFRLKSFDIQVDGEECKLSDNSEEIYQALRHAVLEEIVVYSDEPVDCKKCKVLGLKVQIGDRELHFKTNKCKIYGNMVD